MTRKKQHEKAPAADQPEAVAPDGASEQPEQEAAALVESADRGAAEEGAAEQPGAPSDAGDGSALGVDAGVQDSAGTAVAAEEVGQDGEPVTKVDVTNHSVTMAARNFMELFVGESGDERTLTLEGVDHTELTHRYAALETALAGASVILLVEPDKPPLTDAEVDAALAEVMEGETRKRDRDISVALWTAVQFVEEMASTDMDFHPVSSALYADDAAEDLAELIRKIGASATPDVLAQHMRLKKYLPADAPESVELSALKIFATVLNEIDAFRKAAAKAAEEAMRETPERKPLPIDETTLETIDDPLETW